jgi:hypothetical protein
LQNSAGDIRIIPPEFEMTVRELRLEIWPSLPGILRHPDSVPEILIQAAHRHNPVSPYLTSNPPSSYGISLIQDGIN